MNNEKINAKRMLVVGLGGVGSPVDGKLRLREINKPQQVDVDTENDEFKAQFAEALAKHFSAK